VSRSSFDDLGTTTPKTFTPKTLKSSVSSLDTERLESFYRKDSHDKPDSADGNRDEGVLESIEASIDEIDGSIIDSNKFLYGVFVACVVVQVRTYLCRTFR
jgi:hypothetical protein